MIIDPRWAAGSRERLELMASELVASRPHVIVTQGGALLAFRRTAPAVPIVFGYSGDPVEAGFVESLARPGRTFTGVSFLSLELAGKRIELLKDVLPKLTRVSILASPRASGRARRAARLAGRGEGARSGPRVFSGPRRAGDGPGIRGNSNLLIDQPSAGETRADPGGTQTTS